MKMLSRICKLLCLFCTFQFSVYIVSLWILKLGELSSKFPSSEIQSTSHQLETGITQPINDVKSLLVSIPKDEPNLNDPRNYIVSKEEMNLTNQIIIMPNQCNTKQNLTVFISSKTDSFERRNFLRNTWVSDFKNRNISVYFVIALNLKPNDQILIEEEFEKYGDLIQFGFIDAYLNLTLKSIAILRWSDKYCKTYHVLKVDDDLVINIDLLMGDLDKFVPGINGIVWKNGRPKRDPKSKWYVPRRYFRGKAYPDYMNGPAYLISGFKVEEILEELHQYPGYILRLEDIFITGIIAQLAGVSRHKSKHFKWNRCHEKCISTKYALTLNCHTSDIIKMRWLEAKFTSKYCT